jgi:hypothetical protein
LHQGALMQSVPAVDGSMGWLQQLANRQRPGTSVQ